MIKRVIFILCIIYIASFSISADTENHEDDTQSPDTAQNLKNNENQSTDAGKENTADQDTVQTETLSKKELRAKKREERKEFNDMTISAHKSMLVGSSDHKHGFTKKKKGSTKGPLKPQTICPVMGGPIDKRFY